MRGNDVITLLKAPAPYQDSEGCWHEGERTARTVPCNQMSTASLQLGTLRSASVRTASALSGDKVDVGLRPEAQVQLWTIDYEGEDQCLYHGDEMVILNQVVTGERTLLWLARKLGNGRQDG